jgi:hypothetical protein
MSDTLEPIKSIIAELKEALPKLRTIPKVLYHYCSAESFFKIMKRKKIHLSDISYANDYTEQSWAQKIIKEVFDKIEVNDNWRTKLTKIYKHYFSQMSSHAPFVFCLSESKDLLSQWRGYSDDGEGFCIGLDPEILIKDLNFLSNSVAHQDIKRAEKACVKMIYNEPTQRLLVKFYVQLILCLETQNDLQNLLPYLIELPLHIIFPFKGGKNGQIIQAPEMIIYNLIYLTEIFKNSGFEEENEWRLITIKPYNNPISGDGMPLLAKNSYKFINKKIVPFEELDLNNHRDLIKAIGFGPKNTNRMEIIKLFLKNNGFNIEAMDFFNANATYR